MRTTPLKAKIRQITFSLPQRRESNQDLLIDNPDWDLGKIYEKTGVAQRYVAAPEQTAADLCVEAAEQLLQRGVVSRQEIDGVVLCTQSPDYQLPTTACMIQERLKLSQRVAAFDVNLGCSGFVYGLAMAGSLVETGLCRQVLLLCGETYTRYIDAHDRTCRPLFSDAGSATLIQASEQPLIGPFELGTDGRGYADLIIPNSGARATNGTSGQRAMLKMEGASVFMFTMSAVPSSIRQLLGTAGIALEQIDWFVFHQASKLVLDEIVRHLNLPPEKVIRNLETVGNTVSATIPIALKQAADAGLLKTGQTIMLVGFGVGYSWGACLLQWSDHQP